MKNIFLLLFSFFTTLIMAQNIELELQKIVERNKLMGLTVYTFDGKKEKTYNIGLRNESQKLPITSDTKFRVASISKSLATLGLMKLYDQKMFRLDDDVSKTIGFNLRNPNYPDKAITFRMIMSHTSSIVDGAGYDKFLGETYNVTPIPNISNVLVPSGNCYTEDMFLKKEPGTYFTYCNLNFGILGTLIEKLSNQRFDIYIRNEILLPLGIKSGFNIQDIADIDNVATLYRTENDVWNPQKDDYKGVKPKPSDMSTFIIGANGAFFGPQGGMRCTASDLGKFLRFLKIDGKSAPKLLSKATLREMKKPQWTFKEGNGDTWDGFFVRYGLGIQLANTTKTDKMGNQIVFGDFIGHAGDAYGLISDAYYSEKQNFGIVLITNGCFTAFEKSKNTAFNKFEEEIMALMTNEFIKNNPKSCKL